MDKDYKRFHDLKFTDDNIEKADRIVAQIKTGRPSKYKPDLHPQLLLLLFLEGNNIEAFCYAAEVHRDQFYTWVKKYKEFGEAYLYAKEMALLWWEEKAAYGIIDPSFNNTLWSMVMRNRFRKSEHRSVEVPGLDKALTIKDKEIAISKAITKGLLTGSEITYVTNFLNSCMKVEELDVLRKRLDELEDLLNV
jgi:hypothetical protein